MIRRLAIKYDNLLTRILEIIPGLFLWIIITSPFWMSSYELPRILGNLVLIFAVYWLYRSFIFMIGLILGYQEYRQAMKIDWLKESEELDFETLPNKSLLPANSKLPKHLIVFPIGNARYETLGKSIEAIDAQNYPKELVYISISFEQRLISKDPEYFDSMKKQIRENFSHFGDRLMIFDHPGDIAGEAIGAAANRAWGTKSAVGVLEKNGEVLNDFLITSPDEDIRFHKEFLAAISYQYLIAEKRNQKFFQTAVYLFSNNYWQVPMLIRSWSMSLTLPTLASSATFMHDRETWSCFTVNLDVMKRVNYWDTSIGIDDTPFYWRPFDYFNGDFTCQTFFIPLYADAVYHPKKVHNYVAQYKQLVRWGWGVITFPIAMKVLIKNKNIPFFLKIKKALLMLEVFVIVKVLTIIFTFTVPVIGVINEDFNYSTLAVSLPRTLSMIMRVLTYMLIPTIIYKALLMPPKPPEWSRLKFVLIFLMEIPLHIVLLYTYAFFPFIVGPTKMMFGKKYSFVVTEKK